MKGPSVAEIDQNRLFDEYDAYYRRTLDEHGATPEGVNWNSARAQENRFDQFVKMLPSDAPFSLNDYGCGYGALADYLSATGREVDYHGFDVSNQMIELARTSTTSSGARFTAQLRDLQPADFTVANGVFTLQLDTPDDVWLEYVLNQIGIIAELSTQGFGFNLLTSYSDVERRRPDLYYADPSFYFDYCKRTFSRNVALLHDYGEWEFTIWVRLP
jgi:SAM-dependent methyltransferase